MTRLPLHRRRIDVEICDEDGVLIVVGHLLDSRPWYDDPARQVLHDITITLGIDPTSLAITSAEASMSSFPHAECPLVTARFGNLVGLRVTAGYASALREVFGGVTGCAHVFELARVAGAAVVQGSMSRQARNAYDTGAARVLDPERLQSIMAGTCHVWSEDGPAPAKLELGWRPDGTFPVPSVEELRERRRCD